MTRNVSKSSWWIATGGGVAAAWAACAIHPAFAQADVASFYRGKSITIGVGGSPGGGYDLDARVLSRHLGKHIPGAPGILFRTFPAREG